MDLIRPATPPNDVTAATAATQAAKDATASISASGLIDHDPQ